MKKTLLVTTLALALFAAFAFAQSFDNLRVHFAQPVQVAASTLPAGDYTITTVGMNTAQQFLLFRSDAHSALVPVRKIDANPSDKHDKTTLVLLPDNGALRLSKIWLDDGVSGYEVLAESR